MSFADLPALPPMFHPEAAGYAQRISAGSRAAMRDCRTVLDCAYGPDYWNKLDVYLPPETAARGPWPVVCYWHGGAWSNGCKEWMGFMAPVLVDAPAVFVSLSYRRAPQVRLPEMVADCFQGLQWVRNNIARHGGDPDRLYVGGHSAGAHLAALVALRPDLQDAHGIPASAIRGCFPTSGTFDFRPFSVAAGGVEAQVLQNVLPRPEDAWAWSPLRTLDANRVPFYVTWGERDHSRVIQQSRAFVAALDAYPGRARWDEAPGATHFTVNEDMGRRDSRWVRMVRSIITAKESS